MTKSELIAAIADNAKISKADAGIALEATLLAVKEELLRSGKVVLPAKRKVRFRAAKGLKELVKPA